MNWALNRYILPYQFVVFAYRKTNTKTSGKSQNVNGRSLSTFDSSVSCLYFFDSEYITQAKKQYPAVSLGSDGDPYAGAHRALVIRQSARQQKKRGFR